MIQSPPEGSWPILTMSSSFVEMCITISSLSTISWPYLLINSSRVEGRWKPVATKIRTRASGLTERIRRKMIGVMIWEGTGRVWSELINTMSFLPLASSSKDGLPIGLSNERSTVSSSDSGLWKFSAFDSNKPAKFSSGIFATIVFLSYGNLISTIICDLLY